MFACVISSIFFSPVWVWVFVLWVLGCVIFAWVLFFWRRTETYLDIIPSAVTTGSSLYHVATDLAGAARYTSSGGSSLCDLLRGPGFVGLCDFAVFAVAGRRRGRIAISGR